jgi:hypothetical protein
LEHTVRVLLTAEIIAAVYYQALFQATYSGLLQQICRRILRDEEMHLHFQCFTLHQLRGERGRFRDWLIRRIYGGLLAGTTVLVWLSYHRTLRAGGYGFFAFGNAVWDKWNWVETLQLQAERLTIRGQQPIVLADQPRMEYEFNNAVQPRWVR